MPETFLAYGDKGDRVVALQALLAGSRWGSFHPGPKDGQFGPRTGAACSSAKWHLGYAKSDIQPIAGQPLMDILRGRRELTTLQRLRRKRRLAAEQAAAAAAAPRLKALERAIGELGTVEDPPGSNRIKYSSWFGWGPVAYCVMFVSWCWAPFSGSFKAGTYYANTDVFLLDAKAGRNGLRLTSDPKPGDCGVIDWSGHSDPDHALLVESQDGDQVHTIEGNATDPDTGRQGVFRHERAMRQCWFIRVDN